MSHVTLFVVYNHNNDCFKYRTVFFKQGIYYFYFSAFFYFQSLKRTKSSQKGTKVIWHICWWSTHRPWSVPNNRFSSLITPSVSSSPNRTSNQAKCDRAQQWDSKRSTRKLSRFVYINMSSQYKIRLITCWLDRKATRKPLHNKIRVHEPHNYLPNYHFRSAWFIAECDNNRNPS